MTAGAVERLDDDWPAVFGLLDQHWQGLSHLVQIAASLGVDWRAHSVPFGVRREGHIVAHVGVMRLPSLYIDGRARRIAGIHAVCTQRGHREQGLARRCLAAAAAYAETISEGQLLMAVEPRVYGSHGFRRARSVRHQVELSSRLVGEDRLRPVDLFDETQRRRALGVYQRRARLGDTLAVDDGGWLMILDEMLGTRGRGGRLWWYDDDTVLAGQCLDRELHLYDVAVSGGEPRPMLDYVAAFGGSFRRVYVYFDASAMTLGADARIEGQLRARPIPFGDTPMVRGPKWAAEDAFALSPLAHC